MPHMLNLQSRCLALEWAAGSQFQEEAMIHQLLAQSTAAQPVTSGGPSLVIAAVLLLITVLWISARRG